MTRAEWYAKYREWRVQDRVWTELQRAGLDTGSGCPSFVTWDWALYCPTRKFGDHLGVYCHGRFKRDHRITNTVRMYHLRKHVRLPA